MAANPGFSSPRSSAATAKEMTCDLFASSGLEMVRRAAESRFRTYTSLVFSSAPIMRARPLGSATRCCPGTMRRTPLFPNVSWCTFLNAPASASYCKITTRPESLPSAR